MNNITFSKLKESLTLKLFILGVMTLLLLIPAQMIRNIIHEREERRDQVITEISSKWGFQQMIRGPVLTIPYIKTYKSAGEELSMKEYLHILPETLSVRGSMKPEKRYRGM